MRAILFVAICVTSIGSGYTAATESPRLNIVLIVSDDHGFGDIGWNNPEVKSPTLDHLASEGMRLDRFYVNPICSVTRAAVMTGIASAKTGVGNSTGLDLRYRILPQAFHEAGYQTWMFGKWHLGGPSDCDRKGPTYFPQARGFDYFYGQLGGAIDYYTHHRKDTGELDWQRNGRPVDEPGFSTDLLANDAIHQVRQRDKAKPFLLYLAFNAVHGPLQAPPSAQELAKRDRRAVLLANVTHMDAAIGRLLDCIDQEGLRQNTLVLFFGDNGGQLSQGASNSPLRGEKGNTFEGGIRVPAAIRLPEVLPTGIVSKQFCCAMDVVPTLCAAAGIAPNATERFDGIDLWPAFTRNMILKRPPFVMGNKDMACISEPWKLIAPGRGEAPLLFNVVDDPRELHDVADKRPDIVAALSKEMPTIDGKGRGGGRKNQPGGRKKEKLRGRNAGGES